MGGNVEAPQSEGIVRSDESYSQWSSLRNLMAFFSGTVDDERSLARSANPIEDRCD